MDNHKWKLQTVRISFWVLAVVLGFVQAWAYRFEVYMRDGVSYLDMSDYFRQGDWNAAISSYWSPLYPLLLSCVFSIIQPQPYWEFFVLKLGNLFIFVLLLIAFEIFLSQLISYYGRLMSTEDRKEHLRLPELGWRLIMYALFLWCFLTLGGVYHDTPDLLVGALMLCSSGLLLRIEQYPQGVRSYALLGACLGLGYLAKAIFFPLAFVYILLAAIAGRTSATAKRGVVIAGLVFISIALPLMIVLSIRAGSFTYSGSAGLNYLWGVSGSLWDSRGVQTEAMRATMKHPPRRIFSDPPVTEFATPVGGTWPTWYDPGYWQDGVRGDFDPIGSIKTLMCDVYVYGCTFIGYLVWIWVLLSLVSGRNAVSIKAAANSYLLWLPPSVVLALYAAVINLWMHAWINRYFPACIILLFSSFFCSLRLPNSARGKRALIVAALFMAGFSGFQIWRQLAGDLEVMRQDNVWWKAASQLHDMGLKPGDPVAHFKDQERPEWARLARLKIIAEVEMPDEFWNKDETGRRGVIEAIGATGAKALIFFPAPVTVYSRSFEEFYDLRREEIAAAMRVLGLSTTNVTPRRAPPAQPGSGWRKLEGVEAYVYLL